jgi:hypothetical protein
LASVGTGAANIKREFGGSSILLRIGSLEAMPTHIETTVAQVGLRDFLFYVVPGAVVLAGLFAFQGVTAGDAQPYLSISSSIAGILASYVLGQCAYPVAYPIRAALSKWSKLKRFPGERSIVFRRAYRSVAKDNPTYFAVEVFRYRTMARFCSVMIFPVLFAAAGIEWGQWQLARGARLFVDAAALLISVGFLWRYYRYEWRYRSSLVKYRKERSETADTEGELAMEIAETQAGEPPNTATGAGG